MDSSTSASASAILEIVSKLGQVPGSVLSAELRKRLPDWKPSDSGCRNLRAFVGANVPRVTVQGRSGLDVIYALVDGPLAKDANADSEHPDPWRIWVSPNSSYAIRIDTSSGSVRVSKPGAPLPAGILELRSPNVEFHKELAKRFVAENGGPANSPLLSAIAAPDEQWWKVWIEELRRNPLEFRRWNAFRRKLLEKRLLDVLHEGGLSTDAAANVLAAVRIEHAAATRKFRPPSPETTKKPYDEQLRSAVIAVVHRLQVHQLRDLPLPAGLLFDALEQEKRR